MTVLRRGGGARAARRTARTAPGVARPAPAPGAARPGFTLVEVMVALVIGALVVLLAHRTFAAASDLGGHIAERREPHDRASNARRFLAQAFGSLEVGTVPNTGFRGTWDAVSFAAWLPSADDTVRRHTVGLAAGPSGVVALVAPLRAGSAFAPDTLRLFPAAAGVAFDYLLDFGADAAWVREWQSPVSAPLAVRLRIRRVEPEGAVDTLLFAIGPRG